MNERIEHLAEQCWVHTNEPLFAAKSTHWEFDRQKFAKLIVRECANRIDYWESRQGEHSDDLLKHFGVEE